MIYTVADNQTHPIWYLNNVIFLGKTDVGFETRHLKYV